MNIATLYTLFKKHPEVTTDTRNCPKESIFFALKGSNFNGNEYAQKALEAGCSYAVVDEERYASHPHILLVEDVLDTLQQLANHHRHKLKIPIIAITGTNGKTTTKELVMSVLAKEYKVIATQGNYNNHIGVPLTLLRIQKEHEIAIIEMGANHVGEIKKLAEIAEPNYGLITNLGQAHLEGFGSFENIVKSKCELFDYIRKSKEGKLFVDYDNTLLRSMAKDITSIFYGLEDDLFVSGKILSLTPFLEFEWKFGATRQAVKTQLIGNYNLSNSLAAITIGKYFGVKTHLACKALEEYVPTNNRSQLHKTAHNMLIVDAYNANPTSMQAALDNFELIEVNSKVLILGEMKELGLESDVEHQKIADYVAQHSIERVFLIGENFADVRTNYPRYKNLEEFKNYLILHPIKNSYILLKGSRSVQLENCIELL